VRWNKMLEWFWSLLPDECTVGDCPRTGVRGNENIVDGVVMCDDCHSRQYQQQNHWLILQNEGKTDERDRSGNIEYRR